MQNVEEPPQSGKVFMDTVFMSKNKHLSDQWVSITEIYPDGVNQPLLPSTFSREQFAQGNHYECFMLSTLAALIRFPDIIRNCFVTKKPRRDGRYTFRFFRGKEWVKVEIDDRIALEDDDVLYIRSPTHHWWPLLLEKAYAKFYTAYDHLEGCTLQETFHDLTGNPVLNIPMETKLAKAAGVDINDGRYWLSVGESLRRGDFVASVLTKNANLESVGIQSEQQYAVLAIFSLTGSAAMHDLVAHLHNPFEDDEYDYTGPLNRNDKAWTAKLRAKYDIADRNSIFMPLANFVKMTNSMQMCFISLTDNDATYFDDEWKGETAGGNPTSVTWRKNPLYLVKNSDTTDVKIVVVIKQEDQRRFTDPEENTKYVQCGIVITRASFPHPIPTYYVTGNNHKPVYKSLFLNSREVANTVTIPPNSLCYLVPSTINKNTEARFTLALYRIKSQRYDSLSITKLSIPSINWVSPAQHDIVLREKEKDRVDFYVDEETDVHILMHQTKPFVNKTGGDAMTEDYMGMYLYDDTDRKIGGVHAATNFREVSVIHHLPRSGRFAVSVTCPRAKSDVTAYVTVVGSHGAHVRIVDPPEDATMFDDEDEQIDEGDEAALEVNPVDFTAVPGVKHAIEEQPDCDAPFEDKRFMVDNRAITNDPWVHIGDLYPEGKTQPLLPERLGREQFEQGEHFECCCLSTFAALVEQHADVIRNCFVTRKPRRDGRYTFQFHRYGQWVKVEIDDRIPQVDGKTLYCRSPTHHWWPLLLEKAYAKFYTLYQNLEGCTLQETFHDFTGRPVVNIPMEATLAQAAGYEVGDPQFWLALNDGLRTTALAGLTQVDRAEALGLQDDQSYAILEVLPMRNAADLQLSDILVKLYNPFMEAVYKGPMNKDDTRWPRDLRQICAPEQAGVIFMPADVFCSTFLNVQQLHVEGPLEPCWNFNSEWGEGTNGGNPTLVTWRQNPLYVVRNKSDDPVQLVAMIRQPDQRHRLHLQDEGVLTYCRVGETVARAYESCADIPTYLVTLDNHALYFRGHFLDTREVTELLTFQPHSLNYLVPSAMSYEKGKFMLSYWYLAEGDAAALDVQRLQVDVARELPAVARATLHDGEKVRVDFLVDVATTIHVLLRQDKVSAPDQQRGCMAEDYVGLYLYDADDRLIKGVPTATNFRESSVVAMLEDAGRYALLVTCPRGTGDVPCTLEIVGVEAAHVRITDAPETSAELQEVDLAFLNSSYQGIPLADLPLSSDAAFQSLVQQLKELQFSEAYDEDAAAQLEDALGARCDAIAKSIVGARRDEYVPSELIEELSPALNANEEFMGEERKLRTLMMDPRNRAKVEAQRQVLQELAQAINAEVANSRLDFIDPAPQGIALDDLHLLDDPTFVQLQRQCNVLRQSPAENAAEIDSLEAEMNERANVLASAMHERERRLLDPTPAAIPLALLHLNDDAEFMALEEQLRRLREIEPGNTRAIAELETRVNRRAHDMAEQLKRDERALFLPSDIIDNATLPLDEDARFHALELRRLELRQDDPVANEVAIRELEKELQLRAQELLEGQKQQQRGFLYEDGLNVDLLKDALDSDGGFAAKERELRTLQQDKDGNALAIAALQQDMLEDARAIAAEMRSRMRPSYLRAAYEGWATSLLPLDDDDDFVRTEEAYLTALRNSSAGSAGDEQAQLRATLDRLASDIARQKSVDDRPQYLPATIRGVHLANLPLGEDSEFGALEVRRAARVSAQPGKPQAAAEIEEQLRARAEQLADAVLRTDRAFLDAAPCGVPLRQLGLDDDDAFRALEERRAAEKASAVPDARTIAELERAMNERTCELAGEVKERLRGSLTPTPRGVALTDLPLDEDDAFVALEEQCRDAMANGDAAAEAQLREALNDRLDELAAALHTEERAALDQVPEGVPLSALPLDSDERVCVLEREARALRARSSSAPYSKASADRLRAIGTALDERLHELAHESRKAYCDPAPEGVPLELLHLDQKPEFLQAEGERRALLLQQAEEGATDKTAAALAELEAMLNDMAHDTAKEQLRRNRATLAPEVDGVPLESLPLDDDPAFHAAEVELAKLLGQPGAGDARRVKECQDRLNARARELARALKAEDLRELDAAPGGIELELLKPHDDEQFAQLAATLHELRRDPATNAAAIEATVAVMNERILALARAAMDRDYLDQAPEGVPLADLPLDTDPTFHALEVERAKLKLADAKRNAGKIKELEEQLNDRAHELARRQKADDLAAVDSTRLPLPKELLGLDEDDEIAALLPRLRELKKDPQRNRAEIEAIEDAIARRAVEIAERLVSGERGSYLDAQPEGVDLDDLPLDSDALIRSMEVERARLKARDPRANAAAIRDLESKINQRAHELARKVKDDELAAFKDEYEGVPIRRLRPFDDRLFSDAAAERRRRRRNPVVTFKDDLEQVMDDRLTELAKEQNEGDLYFIHLDGDGGVTVDELALSDDPVFAAMLTERGELKADEPLTHVDAIHALEQRMSDHARAAAAQLLRDDFAGVDETPLGIARDLLRPREDAEVARLIVARRQVRRAPQLRGHLDELVAKLNNRVHELAEAALHEGRDDYLDSNPDGVPLSLLPLDTDPAFHAMEAERATLRLQAAPEKHAARISDLERRLNERAHELAQLQLAEDLKGIDAAPEGVDLALLKPHNDPKLSTMIDAIRALKKDAVRNADKIAALQAEMNDRAHELAHAVLHDDRAFLRDAAGGVPLDELPLDTDPRFHALEVERAALKAQGNGGRDDLARIETALRERCAELAAEQLGHDLDGLDPCPMGVPLSLLNPHADAKFAAMVKELRRLKRNPAANAARVASLQRDMDDRNLQLAAAYLAKDRAGYLAAAPGGVPHELLPLSADAEFAAAEKAKLAQQAQRAHGSESAIRAMETALGERAHQIAERETKVARSRLDAVPEGVPLRHISLDDDDAFRELEVKHYVAKAQRSTAVADSLLEKMNARVHVLANDVKAHELAELEQTPCGLPIASLHPYDDPKFAGLVNELREAKAAGPQVADGAVERLRDRLNARLDELARGVLDDDRGYLDPTPEGIPLRRLPLDQDSAFARDERARATLKLQGGSSKKKNEAQIVVLEDKLNERAHELARAVKTRDLQGMCPFAHDIPITLLDLHGDDAFVALVDRRDRCRDGGSAPAATAGNNATSQAAAAEEESKLVHAMDARARQLAEALLQGDRGYLDPEPEGVPLHMLPLDTDPTFHTTEVERAVLKLQHPRGQQPKLGVLEGLLNDRACALARQRLAGDRDSYLRPNPRGVSLSELPLDTDGAFHGMEVERASAKAAGDTPRMRELEARLNERAEALAAAQLADDLRGLQPTPAGYPLEYLHPHDDAAFAAHIPALRAAKRVAGRTEEVRGLQDALNARAVELAKAHILADRAFLDPAPEGVPLELLPLDDDRGFASAESALRDALATRATTPDHAAVGKAQAKMAERAAHLARDLLQESRQGLDGQPEGVPLAELPLDTDAEFRELEQALLRELAKANGGAAPDAKTVAALRAALNDRAHALAAAHKQQSRGFLRPHSHGIPRELLRLDEEPEFVRHEHELQRLGKTQHGEAERRRALEARLQDIADAVAVRQLSGDRDKYLGDEVDEVPVAALPLDTDEAFGALELQRALLIAKDPHHNRAVAAEVERQLRERAGELAAAVVVAARADFLPAELHGIPVDSLPLDGSAEFRVLERRRLRHLRSPATADLAAKETAELCKLAEAMADLVAQQDLAALKPTYRGIAAEELGLHNDPVFRELANKLRRSRGQGRVKAADVAALEDELDARATEIADDVVDNERAFLDPQPEGMFLTDVPLDKDAAFRQLEKEYRRLRRAAAVTTGGPAGRSGSQHEGAATVDGGAGSSAAAGRSGEGVSKSLAEVTAEMNRRAHQLARGEFARRRGFMDAEPEGVALDELDLDNDQAFKESEVALYLNERDAAGGESGRRTLRQAMNDRAHALAKAHILADRAFLDPAPEGVPLELLPLDDDRAFSELARERRAYKRALRASGKSTSGAGGGGNEAAAERVRAAEARMNVRAHELAKDFLQQERGFLGAEVEGVPLSDLCLAGDAVFRGLELERLRLRHDTALSAREREDKLGQLEAHLQDRAQQIALDLLRKERDFLDPAPHGVALDELALNHDPALNRVERERRRLRRDPTRHATASELRECEAAMAARVDQLARDFVAAERAFLEPAPLGVALRYLPLDTDDEFSEMEQRRRKLRRLPSSPGSRESIADLERGMAARVRQLAEDVLQRGRAFLEPEPCGVPLADLPLDADDAFRALEERRRELKAAASSSSPEAVRGVEARLNDRARELAAELLARERAFMDPAPEGVALSELPLNEDQRMRELERLRRRLRREDGPLYADDVATLERGMNDRAHELAKAQLARDRAYLDPAPRGVPLDYLPLATDEPFRAMEAERRRLRRVGGAGNKEAVAALEERLRQRADELAAAYLVAERAYLEPSPEGVALAQLPLDTDPVFHAMELERRQLRHEAARPGALEEIERLLNRRARELALVIRGWHDDLFHAANEHLAASWPRVGELFPEGQLQPLEPQANNSGPEQVSSARGDVGYLAPFLAALSRFPVLLQRLFVTKAMPGAEPYTFVFFDPSSNPVYVDIDDRVPCDGAMEPRFTRSPRRAWWPLLLEKAYAKFVGGYEQLDNCTPHETLRDLTGRPVTHVPFDRKLAAAINLGDYTSTEFWHYMGADLARGDLMLCLSGSAEQTRQDGIHAECSYAIVAVIETVEGSANPADVIVKLHNAYCGYEPRYCGPLSPDDPNWTDKLRRLCHYDTNDDAFLYLPLPTFLRNFGSVQRCHINCGDRLTATGAWEARSTGGNPKYTTFRHNPIYLVENKSTRPAVILAEVRHAAPAATDADGLRHYPLTGLALLQPIATAAPVATPLLTNSTHRFLQKGMMLDSREVCEMMELPAQTTCYLVPYTMKAGQLGTFQLSVYPGMAKVTLTPLRHAGLSREPVTTRVTLSPGEEGRRLDFLLTVATDVHVLLRQEKMSNPALSVKGDAVAEDDVVITAYNEQGVKIASSGDATNAREHALVLRANRAGRYSLLLTSPNAPVTGDCPCTVSLYTPKRVPVKFIPTLANAPLLQPVRFPTLMKPPPMTTRRLQAVSRNHDDSVQSQADSLPPLPANQRSGATTQLRAVRSASPRK